MPPESVRDLLNARNRAGGMTGLMTILVITETDNDDAHLRDRGVAQVHCERRPGRPALAVWPMVRR